MKEKLNVNKMTCAHCENRVNTTLLAIEGVQKSKANAKKNEVSVVFDESLVNIEKIKAAIVDAGYEVE